MVRHAHAYHRELEWNVIPVGPDKKPPMGFEWGRYQTERITEAQIDEWWERYPTFGIAVITGKKSNVIVFDVDIKDNRSPREFLIPSTVTSRTQSGGWHFFFKYPGHRVPSSNGQVFGKGIDIKADGSYAVLPPTQGENGLYSWVVAPNIKML